jgi:hypothetical protein
MSLFPTAYKIVLFSHSFLRSWRKLLGIISVNFDITNQILIRYSALDRYGENGNILWQYISCLQSSRRPKLTTHLHLLPRSRTRGTIPPLSQHVFMACCFVKHRDKFTFTYDSVRVEVLYNIVIPMKQVRLIKMFERNLQISPQR